MSLINRDMTAEDLERIDGSIKRTAESQALALETIWVKAGEKLAGLDHNKDGTDAEWIVQQAAEAQVASRLWSRVVMVANAERFQVMDNPWVEALSAVAEEATEMLLSSGADDTWSGRHNDMRRTQFDAQRGWVDGARRMLRYGWSAS